MLGMLQAVRPAVPLAPDQRRAAGRPQADQSGECKDGRDVVT